MKTKIYSDLWKLQKISRSLGKKKKVKIFSIYLFIYFYTSGLKRP